MYQKCPICHGTDIDKVSAYTSDDPTCPACKGKRIISKITGKPPNQVVATEAKSWICKCGFLNHETWDLCNSCKLPAPPQ